MKALFRSYRLGGLLIALAALFTGSRACAQTFQWAVGSDGTSNVQTADIATDASGNSYVTGEFYGQLIIGTDTITSAPHWANGPELFVAKFDTDGNPIWVRRASGPGQGDICQGENIALDAVGNAYVTGYYRNNAGFGIDTITSVASNSNVFIAKIDPNGNWLWAQTAGIDNLSAGTDIAVSGSGNVYVGGYFFNQTAFGTDTLTSSGLGDLFLAQYDLSGNYQWVRQLGGADFDAYGGMDADVAGNVYVTGAFDSQTTIGAFNLAGNGLNDIFVAKYDVNGNTQWALSAGGTGADHGYGIAADPWGNSYVTGRFQGAITFGPTTILSAGGDDFLLVKYDGLGNLLWARRGGGPDFATTSDITTTTTDGRPVVTGYFSNQMIIGFDTLTNNPLNGSTDMFVAKYDTAGNATWARNAGSSSSDDGEAVDVDPNGNIYVTGRLTADGEFDAFDVITNNTTKIYVTKLNDWLMTVNVSGLVQCSNPPITVTYVANGPFTAGNTFTAQLSDEWGNFGSPVNIGSVSSTSSGNITCNIPGATPNGLYRIRVVASQPNIIGTDNGFDLPIELGPPDNTLLSTDTLFLCAGDSVHIFSPQESGVSYQWWFNSATIAGATNPQYWASQEGLYHFSASNSCGNVTSNIVELVHVVAPVASVTASGPLTFCPGGNVSLSTPNVVGSSYQWYDGGNVIAGATSNVFVASTEGNYSLQVNNDCGWSISSPYDVVLLPLPVASISAFGPTTICAGGAVQLLSDNDPNSTYQWYLDGMIIAGATDTLWSATDAGVYTLDVTNSCGTLTSNGITVTIATVPTSAITVNDSLPMCVGDSALLSSGSTGATQYQWMLDGSNIFGATSAWHYANTPGNYQLNATNSCGADTSQILVVAHDSSCIIGIDNTFLLRQIQLYPNPSNGLIYLEFDGAMIDDMSVSVLDVRGKVVWESNEVQWDNNTQIMLNVEGVPAGVYLLKMQVGNAVGVQRIVIL